METKDKLYYYHNDINGAPLRLTDEVGNIVWNAHYNIFGKIDKISKNEIDNPIRMQGQYEDSETGLYYNRYRYYDPNISAYVSQDPLGLGAGENVYSYVKNSFGWIDPMGLSGCKKKGDYSHLEDSNSVGAGKDFTPSQKRKIIEENRKKNNGVVKSDKSGTELVKPEKSMKGVTPNENEWQIDHIQPKDKGGTNSFSNAQVLSRQENREKWNN